MILSAPSDKGKGCFAPLQYIACCSSSRDPLDKFITQDRSKLHNACNSSWPHYSLISLLIRHILGAFPCPGTEN